MIYCKAALNIMYCEKRFINKLDDLYDLYICRLFTVLFSTQQ